MDGPLYFWFGGGWNHDIKDYWEEHQNKQTYDVNLGAETITDDQLLNLYTACRQRNVSLLLDIGPNRHGLVNSLDIKALKNLRKSAKI